MMDSAGPSISYTPAHGTKSGGRVEIQDSEDGNAVSQSTVAEARLRSVVVEIRGVIYWSRSQDGRCDGMDLGMKKCGNGVIEGCKQYYKYE